MRDGSDGVRILHVDDEPAFSDLAAEFLEREDDRFVIETVTDAEEGLERLGEVWFDCVVSDYEMPGMNGIEFLRAVREERPDVPFILYTGKGSEAIASDAISAGVTDYLQKETGTGQYTVLANRIANAVEQYRAKRRIEKSQRRLSLFFEQSPLGVIEWTQEFECARLNETAEEILGYSETELVGRSWELIVPESERESVGEAVADLQAAEGGYHGVNENLTKDGERIVCEWHNRVITDDSGEVVSIFSQFQDVTERREHERELARYERIVECLDDIATVIDPDGTITYVSPSVERVLGYEPSDLVGENGFGYQPEETATAVAEAIADVVETPDATRTVQTRFRRADGSFCWIESTLRNRLDDDMIEGILVSSRDVTERRERRNELRRQNERLDEFASVVSHDLRNPLRVAEARLELAAEECESTHLEAVGEAHDRMTALIDDLLTLAREGQQVSDTEPVAIGTLTGDCWENVSTPDATLRVESDRTILADPARLKQLLENLFRNAAEHGSTSSQPEADDAVEHADGGVTVTVGDLEDGFYVADDGPGIPEPERDRAFDAGYSTTEAGTGFGLSIVEEVAEAHGWSIRLTESAEGGARFEITGVDPAE